MNEEANPELENILQIKYSDFSKRSVPWKTLNSHKTILDLRRKKDFMLNVLVILSWTVDKTK